MTLTGLPGFARRIDRLAASLRACRTSGANSLTRSFLVARARLMPQPSAMTANSPLEHTTSALSASAIERVAASMRDQPWGVTEEQGRLLYDFVLRERPERILELGCGIGTSACYMTAALAQLGRGMLTSIDCNPELPDWVSRTFDKVDLAFRNHHELVISATSYNDELMRIIASQTPRWRLRTSLRFLLHRWCSHVGGGRMCLLPLREATKARKVDLI